MTRPYRPRSIALDSRRRMASLPGQVADRPVCVGPADQSRVLRSAARSARVRRATDMSAWWPRCWLLAGIVAAQPPGRSSARSCASCGPSHWLAPSGRPLIGCSPLWAASCSWRRCSRAGRASWSEALLAVVLAGRSRCCPPRRHRRLARRQGDQRVVHRTCTSPASGWPWRTALICVVNAHLTRPLASAGRRLLALGAAGALLQGRTTVGGTAAAVLVGVAPERPYASRSAPPRGCRRSPTWPAALTISASARRISRRRSTRPRESSSCARGSRVGAADDQGLRPRRLRQPDAREVLAHDLVPRRRASVSGLNRSQGAEREALLTLLARNAGAPTAEVVTAGATARGDSLVVLRVSGTPLESLPPEQVDDAALRESWSTVERLGEATSRTAASALLRARRQSPGEVSLVDFGGGTVAPDENDRLTDRAQLLATTAAAAGTERAVSAALAAIGRDEVTALLPYLQQAAFGQPLRRALEGRSDRRRRPARGRGGRGRERAAGAGEAAARHLGDAAAGRLLVLAAIAVLSFVGGVDFDQFKRRCATRPGAGSQPA